MHFGASFVDGEMPVGGSVLGISALLPGRDRAPQALAVGDAAVEALAIKHRELQFRHIEPTAVLGCVVEFEPLHQAEGFGGREGLVEGRRAVCAEIVEHHGDAPGAGMMVVDEGFHLPGEVVRRALRADLDVAPSGLRLEREEEIGGAAPAVFIIDARRAPRCGWQRRADFLKQLPGLLIEADHRPLGIIGLGIESEHLFHPPDEIGPDAGDAPVLLRHGFRAFF